VFKQHAKVSPETINSAHIEKDKVLDALKELGVDIMEEDLQELFDLYDANGDGSIDEEEFKGIVRSQSELPRHDKFMEVFNKICRQEGKTVDGSASSSHIPLSALSYDNLKDLGLTQIRVRKCLARLSGALHLEKNEIDFDEFHYAVLSTCVMVHEHDIGAIFRKFAVPGQYLFIPKDMFRLALRDLGIMFTENQMFELSRTVKLNFNDRLDFHAFKHIVQLPSPVVTWVESLSIATLLADAMPKHEKCDHLRVISTLQPKEIGCIVDEICSSLKAILASKIAELRGSLRVMDEEAAKTGRNAGGKYSVAPMKAGNISHYHGGMKCKLGEFLVLHARLWPCYRELTNCYDCLMHGLNTIAT
jgi:Ca2+-binding EF-hand superfamily protein